MNPRFMPICLGFIEPKSQAEANLKFHMNTHSEAKP